ncbi:MAG: LapA family protein [Gammaproteobacteria bacterium]|nr:LapA family protein [Gammaproteobacteria bacterium]
MKIFRTLIMIIGLGAVALLALVFDALNPANVQLDLAFGSVDVRKAKAFAIAVFLGWILGVLTVGGTVLRLLNERRRIRKSMRTAETEIHNLRNIPIQDVE